MIYLVLLTHYSCKIKKTSVKKKTIQSEKFRKKLVKPKTRFFLSDFFDYWKSLFCEDFQKRSFHGVVSQSPILYMRPLARAGGQTVLSSLGLSLWFILISIPSLH